MGKRRLQDKDDKDTEDNMPRSAANARERTRMRVLSKSFERLKLMLPWVPADTKLSKLDTLRLVLSISVYCVTTRAASLTLPVDSSIYYVNKGLRPGSQRLMIMDPLSNIHVKSCITLLLYTAMFRP